MRLILGMLLALSASLSRGADTPDLMQSSPEAGLPYGGAPYCGPVAASNSMIWLSRHGFPRLASGSAVTAKQQGELAMQLGKLMNTTRLNGTKPKDFLTGLEKYVLEKRYPISSLKYQGWEKRPKRFEGGAILPQLAFIQTAMDDERSAVWLKLGWYRYFPAQDKYIRFAGHWVTVVGAKDAATLIVHDPAPRSGPNPQSDEVALTRIEHGKLLTGFDGDKVRDAKGFYKLGGGLKIKEKADCGILDGVVVLRL